jgi:Domain of unknown function (DUF4440)
MTIKKIDLNQVNQKKYTMKKLIFLLAALQLSAAVFCQTKISKKAKLKAQIIALEKAGWEAWKNNNADWFKANTTEECLWINAEGITDKTQMIKSTSMDCNVKTVSLDNFKFVVLNENAVLLTYVAMQDGYCGDKKLAEKIRASVNYVKRGGKWLEAFYMETPVVQ